MPQVPASLKLELERKARELIESELKPAHVQPPPQLARFNYIADIYTKWHRGYFYFCARYDCPGPNAREPSFESKFARLEHLGGGYFALAFARPSGQWVDLYTGLSLDECLAAVRDDPFFQP
ncbi:MAG: hypothetical protein JXA37_07565 [Chloroflexia bacterium]|nr:hypothetical protein [Chloroflexia bacterium]